MSRPVDQTREHHQQPRHQTKHRKKTDEHGLDQHKAHVRAEPVLHERQREQAGDRGQTAAGDLGDGLAQRGDGRLARRLIRLLLGKAVAEDDGIVDRERQLQHERDRVGHKGDLAHEEVRAHVQQRRRAKGQQQHRDLAVGAGGEQQHENDDDKGDDVDDDHLAVDDHLQRIADLGVDIQIICRQTLFDLIERRLAGAVVSGAGKGHVKERGELLVVVGAVVEFHLFHVLDRSDLVGKSFGLLERDVAHDDLRRVIGDELPIHDIEPEPGLGIGGKEVLETVVRHNKRARIHAHKCKDDEHDQDQPSPVDDVLRDARHQTFLTFHLYKRPFLLLWPFTRLNNYYKVSESFFQ